MSKLKELELELDGLLAVKESCKKERAEVVVKKTIELGELYSKYFSGSIEEGDTIVSNLESFEVRRDHPELSYQKEVMTVYFRNRSWEDRGCKDINLSFYSTSTCDDFELNRMILIGKFGQTVLDFKDDIIGEYNLIQVKWNKETKNSSSKVYESEKAVSEKRKEIEDVKRELLESDLEKGIVLNDSNGINIQVGFNHIRRRVKKIKKLGQTSSGKSIKVQMTLENEEWNPTKNKWVPREYDIPETLMRRNYFCDFLYSLERDESVYNVVNI